MHSGLEVKRLKKKKKKTLYNLTRHDQFAQLVSPQTRPHWPLFYVHNKMCKNDIYPAYRKKTRMSEKWDNIFECRLEPGLFQLAKSSDRIWKMEVSFPEPYDVIRVTRY